MRSTQSVLIAGCAAAAAFLVGAPAHAQGAGAWAGPWSGVYAGGRIGYDFLRGGKNERVLFDNNLDGGFGDTVRTPAGANAFGPGFCGGKARGATPATGCRKDKDGLAWAVHFGTDFQPTNSGLVVGYVLDFGMSDAKDRVSAFSTTPAFYTLERRMKWSGSARARAGYAAGPILIYGTGGVALARIKNRFTTNNVANAFSSTGNDDKFGYRVGGGVEYRLSRGFSVGTQYLYTRIGDSDYRVRAANSGTTSAANPFLLVNANGTDFRRSRKQFATHDVAITGSVRF